MNTQPFDREAFARQISVSRETLDKLEQYAGLLTQWQSQMNLVGPATLPDVWQRHFLDSAQLIHFVPGFTHSRWLDVGAGAGFPGMILAILGAREVHLVDSVAKKCRFLVAVQEALGLTDQVNIHCGRIEQLQPWPVDIITARAVAPLAKLFDWTAHFWLPNVRGLFLKGESASEELTQAGKSWTVTCSQHVSLSDPRGRIIDISALRRTSKRQKP